MFDRSGFTGAVPFLLGVALVLSIGLLPGALGLGASGDATDASGLPILPRWIYYPLIAGLGVLWLVSLISTVVARFRNATTPDSSVVERRKERIRLILVLVGAFLFFYLLLAFVASFITVNEQTQEQTSAISAEYTGGADEEPEEVPYVEPLSPPGRAETVATRDSSTIPIVTTVAALALAAILTIHLVRRVKRDPVQDEREEQLRLRRELLHTTRHMLTRIAEGTDDREAVIAAYAILEDTFAQHGKPRSEHQTPREYLDAFLADDALGIGNPGLQAFRRLAGLFEIARFSAHPVTPQERREAFTLLTQIEVRLGDEA